MRFGVVRWIQFVATLVVVGPVAMVGVVTLLEGDPMGAAFVALAVVLLAFSEYLYLRFYRGTVGRVGRLRQLPPWR